MKKLISLALALLMLLSLAACSALDISGTYWATACEKDGEEQSYDGEYLELDDDGTGVVKFGVDEFDIEWELKGGKLTFVDDEGYGFEGRYDDGVIEGEYAGWDYVYELGSAGSKGGSKGDSALVAKEDSEPEPVVSDNAAAFEPIEAVLGDFYIRVVGVEEFIDSEDAPAMRIYYDFTNNSDDLSYGGTLTINATQSGFELVSTYASSEDDVPEYGNDWDYIYPGVTIRCIEEISYQPTAGPVSVEIEHWSGDESLSFEIDPADFPGRPETDWESEPVTDPMLTYELSDEGYIEDSYYFIGEAEPTEVDGQPAIRVFVEYTNGTEEDMSCWLDSSFYAFQDGIELDQVWVEETEEDRMYREEIAPGETIDCAIVWTLNSRNPIEVYHEDIWAETAIGARYDYQ